MKPMWLAPCTLILAMACQREQPAKPPASDPAQAAADALSVLQQLVNGQNYRDLGFESADDVKQAVLTPPLEVQNVGLDQLTRFEKGADVNGMLTKSSQTIYPVAVRGEVRSSVTIVGLEGRFKPSSFGNAALARELARYRQAGAADFVVRVPALNLYFIARRVEKDLLLTPIVDDPRLKLPVGQAVPAEVVLEQLVPVAREYNGLPI